jgi:hypothetical protein
VWGLNASGKHIRWTSKGQHSHTGCTPDIGENGLNSDYLEYGNLDHTAAEVDGGSSIISAD